MKTFLGINFIMGIIKLLSLEDCWSTDKCVGNEKIQNVMARTRFQSILQNLHFSSKDNDDKTDKSYKIRPVIEHQNKVFAECLSNNLFQSDVTVKQVKSINQNFTKGERRKGN